MPGFCGHLWNHTQHCWRGPLPHPALHYPPIPLKKKGKNLLNRRTAIKTTAKSMKGQQGWKETKGVRTVSGGQVQQLTQKNSSTPHLKNTKLEEKGKTVEGWKYPTSPGSFPEICVRSRTITVWNESDHWLKLILEREFLFSNPQQPGIKIPIGHFWLQNCTAKGKAFGTFFLVKFCCPHDSK